MFPGREKCGRDFDNRFPRRLFPFLSDGRCSAHLPCWPHSWPHCSAPRAASGGAAEILPPQPYTRVANPDSNTVQLQIAVRKFVPLHHRGPAIWLAGTSHIGEPAYYHALQQYLDARTVVLYEGINTEAHKNHVSKPRMAPSPNAPSELPGPTPHAGGSFSMQATMAGSLGLVFQLDAIDYDRTNFLNSDLSLLQLQRLMIGEPNAGPAAPGQPVKTNPSFESLLQIMDGSSFLGSLFKLGLQFVGANPHLQALAKLALIEALGQLQGDFSEMRGLPPDMKQLVKVLIEARNQNVVADLQTECGRVPRSGSIAVFYGTGHMEDLERRVTRGLHYRPDSEIWLTAFSVDLHQACLSLGRGASHAQPCEMADRPVAALTLARPESWGVAPGWHGAAPLALRFRAKGPAPCQPGPAAQVNGPKYSPGLKARPILGMLPGNACRNCPFQGRVKSIAAKLPQFCPAPLSCCGVKLLPSCG